MANLEKFVKDHLDEFDSHEPEPGHFKRFENRLNAKQVAKPVANTRLQILKIAALIIILITVSVFVFDFATREIRERFEVAEQGSELPAEIREAVQYYDNQANNRMADLYQLAANHVGAKALSASALQDIQNLDAATDELMRSLAGNPGNEKILDAIIRNQRMKETMLNTIITRISEAKR
jgi:hypothetical protein